VQLYHYFLSQSSEVCCHNLLCCFSTTNTKGKHIFRYRLSLETFGYTLVYILLRLPVASSLLGRNILLSIISQTLSFLVLTEFHTHIKLREQLQHYIF